MTLQNRIDEYLHIAITMNNNINIHPGSYARELCEKIAVFEYNLEDLKGEND